MSNKLIYKIFCLFSTLLLFSSCAKNLSLNYSDYSNNDNVSKSFGTLYLEPSRASEMTSVTIDDNLIVSKKHVKSITIENIPVGVHNVHYSAGNWTYKEKLDEHIQIDIKTNKKTSKIVSVPPYSTAYWIYSSALAITSGIVTYFSLSNTSSSTVPTY